MTTTQAPKKPNLLEIPMPSLGGIDLSEEMAERPWTVLGAGFLAGYVLGGGLFTRLTGRLIGAAARAVAVPVIARELVRLVDGAPGRNGHTTAPPDAELVDD